MAKISLTCTQCGGNIILDNSHEIGTCEHCLAQFVIKEDQIIQNITQNITKHVYGYEGKDVEELLNDGYKLMDLGDDGKANAKFRKAIDVEPNCWSAWLGYASTGGDRSVIFLLCLLSLKHTMPQPKKSKSPKRISKWYDISLTAI